MAAPQPGRPDSAVPAPAPTVRKPLGRQARRAATWRAVHEAAVQEVLGRGLAEATVVSISARAGVSPRTFFNYFPTKEDAVLGTREPELSGELFEAFLADAADPLSRTVRLVAGVLRTGTDAGPAFRRRRELVRTFPELRRRTLQHVQAAERIAGAALAERLAPGELAVLAPGGAAQKTADPEPRPGPGPDGGVDPAEDRLVPGGVDPAEDRLVPGGVDPAEDRLAALLMLAGTVVRYAFTRDPEGFHADHVGAVDSALAVFRGALGATSPGSAP